MFSREITLWGKPAPHPNQCMVVYLYCLLGAYMVYNFADEIRILCSVKLSSIYT